jgi:hypothetical protein
MQINRRREAVDYDAYAVLMMGNQEVSKRQTCSITIKSEGSVVTTDRQLDLESTVNGMVRVAFISASTGDEIMSMGTEVVPRRGDTVRVSAVFRVAFG